MKLTHLLAALMLLCATTLGQAADQGSDALEQFYEKVQQLSTDFQQVQRDDDGKVVQQASGTFDLSRPKQFRWEYKKPYQQVILSDGDELSFYDKDLAQVTKRDIGATLKATPALLLTGGEELDEAFEVTEQGQDDGLTWVHLKPRKDDTDFKEIELGLEDNVPSQMKLHDKMGQTTTINFGHVEINQKLDDSKFELDLPKDVEVVDGREQEGAGQAPPQ